MCTCPYGYYGKNCEFNSFSTAAPTSEAEETTATAEPDLPFNGDACIDKRGGAHSRGCQGSSCAVSCSRERGWYPDKGNCHAFLYCSGTSASSLYMKCPPGTMFDVKTKECTWPHLADTSQCDMHAPPHAPLA